jgi:hypothetical protein
MAHHQSPFYTPGAATLYMTAAKVQWQRTNAELF